MADVVADYFLHTRSNGSLVPLFTNRPDQAEPTAGAPVPSVHQFATIILASRDKCGFVH